MRSRPPRKAFVTIACASAWLVSVPVSTARANPPPPGRRSEQAPRTATPANAIEVWGGYGCYASWSDGGWIRVDCPPELAQLNGASMSVAPDGKGCIVGPGDVHAPCPAVLTEPAVPGERPPASSGKARACGRCQVGSPDDGTNERAMVASVCGVALFVTRRTTRRRARR